MVSGLSSLPHKMATSKSNKPKHALNSRIDHADRVLVDGLCLYSLAHSEWNTSLSTRMIMVLCGHYIPLGLEVLRKQNSHVQWYLREQLLRLWHKASFGSAVRVVTIVAQMYHSYVLPVQQKDPIEWLCYIVYFGLVQQTPYYVVFIQTLREVSFETSDLGVVSLTLRP